MSIRNAVSFIWTTGTTRAVVSQLWCRRNVVVSLRAGTPSSHRMSPAGSTSPLWTALDSISSRTMGKRVTGLSSRR